MYPICATFVPKNGGDIMSKTAMVRARVQPDLKDHAENVFHRLGLNATQAITMFYRQVELRDGLPFDVVVPTATTKRTFEDSEAGRNLVVCENADDMFRKLGL
jgi:DNA-damage-inducible protein J